MSWVAIIWSMIASACLTLAVMHLLVWCGSRNAWISRALGVAAAMCCLVTIETQAARSTFLSDSEYLIDTWETEDGLPENSATAMVQTPDGYLWFGTWNGLVRFDGVSFTVFNRGNTPQLPNAGIVNLHLDLSGRLWVSTLEGLVVRDATQWRAFGTNEGWRGNFVRTFTGRPNGDLLLTTFDGHVMEFVGGRLKELPAPPGQPDSGYFGAVDETGQWWVTQRDFVGRWDGQRWVHTVPRDKLPRVPEVPSLAARDGGVWILSGKELLKFRQGTEISRVPVPQMAGGIWSLSEDSRTNVWICSYNAGLFRLDTGGSLTHWTTTNGLPNLGCRFVFEDRERNLWVGTGGGLTRFKPRRFHEVGMATLLARSQAKSISPAIDGGMWLATYDNGLFRHDASGVSHTDVPIARNAGRLGLSVLEDRAGRLWYGIMDGCWWRPASGSFQVAAPTRSGDANISALFEDSKGRVWMAGRLGVVMYEDGRFQKFGADTGLPRGGVACFGEDQTGVPWLAAGEGVFRYEKDRFVQVRTVDAKPLRDVSCFKADPDGTMWMGTRTHGLLRLRDGRLSAIESQAGFPVQAVHAILEDAHGYFWMPSNRGIVRASRKELHAVADGDKTQLDCQLLDQHDGLPSAECSTTQPNCTRDRLGSLWFATQRGVAMIDPASFRLNSLPPPVRIEQLDYRLSRASSKTGERQPSGDSGVMSVQLVPPLPEPLRLQPGSYGLEIKYTALSFSSPEKLRFQTRLEGGDRDWEEAHDLRMARFYQLQPGDYVFRVRAANDDGVWNETGARLAFTVLPFYWQTVWFRVMSGIALLASGAAAAWLAIRAKHRRAAERARAAQAVREVQERMNLAVDEAARENDKRMALTAEAANLGIWIRDLVRNEIWATESWRSLLGFTKSESLHLDGILQRVHPEDREALSRTLTRAVESEGHYETEYRVVLPDGGLRWIASRGRVELNDAGKPIFVRGVSLDITTRKQTEAEALRQRAELAHVARVSTMGELAASVAHELNQPLGAILANAEAADLFLSQDPPALDELRAILVDIRKDDERASEVIRRMRALLRKHELERLPLEINSVVEDVFQVVSGDAALRTIAISAELSPSLPKILGDRVHLQQVLINLILNGMDAMAAEPRERRRLSVRTRVCAEGLVELTVIDSGHGIAPEKLTRLFEPFFTTKTNGMGMGLSISRTIIEAHRGKISAENNPSGGATFRVTLPVSGAGKQ